MLAKTYLIIEQQQKPAENLPELLQELSIRYGLDIYQARQRLVGRGLSLLHRGEREQLEQISSLLGKNRIVHWLIEPSKPEFVPRRLRSLEVEAEQIVFHGQQRSMTLAKGATVLAVFAEMSGVLAEKSVTQLLSSHAYRGRDNVRHLEGHKILRTILQGKPILDLYLLDAEKRISDAVRILPGKFDPKGLGKLATVSSTQNIDRILKLAEEYAGNFTLITDFGLVNLPGCTLRRENPDDPDTERQNQLSLARYGWLLADLQRVGPVATGDKQKAPELSDTITAAMLLQNPALANSGQLDEVMPLAKEIADEIEQADREQAGQKTEAAIAEEGLPAPPPSQRGHSWNRPSSWFGSAGAILFVGFIALAELDKSGTLNRLVRQAVQSGAAFFCLSALLVWAGFYFIQLKRHIENTPTSKIRSIAMGMVEVKGRALRQYALISPMSHVPCVFYRLTKYRREKNQWQVTSTSSSNSVPFLLEDDTGRIEINPAGCRVSAGTKQEGMPGQVGLSHRFDDGDEKWVEEIIVEGTLLYVLGFASVKKEQGPSLAERKVEALRELKRNPQDIQQFDRDGDGRISEDEWDQARAAVEEKVLHDELQKKQQRKKQEEHVVIGKMKGRPLVIAETHSEQHLTNRYGIYGIGAFVLACAALGWGINNLLKYLH